MNQGNNMIRVLIADDHNVFVEGIDSLLSGAAHIEVVERCYSCSSVLESLTKGPIDVILLDLSFPHIEDGLALCETITRQYPSCKIIALTMHDDASLIKRVVKKGAQGYLLKNTTKLELLEAIGKVHEGKNYFNEVITQILLTKGPKAKKANGSRLNLTPRESEVLTLIAQGLTTQQMANQLFVSIKAIEFHRSSLLLKFDVPNTAVLIKTAMEMQYLD
ncbi:two-component system response regulator NreC [Siphonobacter sp. SORGH_AS 1065]|nr:two-component system response regulator NreC [Siphonobacter sp. SORGH_AS_1065]